ncbi:hypothetical protein pipiens_004377 [Culex pipiens pipiens]|uniref:Peptidase S1 domain-containing protein n=1 Tax=Culex pipiens pipiens TaxID=38569 RepID=A0ABD1CJB5_CULPP
MKSTESGKKELESELKSEKDRYSSLEKELDQLRKEKSGIEGKVSKLEDEIQQERNTMESAKAALEREIASLKRHSASDDPTSLKLQELSQKNNEIMSKLEEETRKYQQLVSKHEHLEEDHVMLKAQLESNKQKFQELDSLKNKLVQADNIEARLVKENTNLSRKLVEMQKKVAQLESNAENRTAGLELERDRLKSALEDKQREYEHLSSENEMNAYQVAQLRKDSEDLRSKLDDYERINKAQRTLSEHNSHLEQELKKMHLQLETAEMNVKSEVAATRLRYEQQVTNLHNELTGLQRQCERFKRDRDTFKQLVEAAQKQIGDMKANRRSLASVTSTSSDDDDKSKIVALEQQIGCLEDELSEARLEASKVRTELISELSASEIKLSEMQSKINELEEEKIIAGGKSKVPGTKTRLELSWQKEREDMQRLVQETSTLARDLRQTLFEVERERDKEKLESRRKIDQIKKTTEEEIEEGRRKVTELQSDLLELRDAHAKLRTANEKLRRDRERADRERESATRRRIEMESDRRIGALLQTVDELVKLAPEMQKVAAGRQETTTSTGKTITANAPIPTPPMRHKSPSPGPGGATPQPQSITSVLSRLAEASEELRRFQRMCDEEKDRERMRRGGMRRAASQENDSVEGHSSRPVMRLNRNGGSLYKKSLSLDQSLQVEQQGQLIWKEGDDSMSSLQSLDSEYGAMMHNRDSSLDSRLSGGSTQSDMPRMRKKKRGLMGKLRSLSLTRSKGSESDFSIQGSDSDLSMAGDIRSSKTNLKGKLSGMFRRAGSSSRAGSSEALDREIQRPVAIQTMGNGPTGQPPVPRPVSASNPHLARFGFKDGGVRMGFKCSVSALVAVIIALATFSSFSHANPHIEDELVEIKDELGEVFSSSIPDDYYQRMDLKDCHTRFHARPVNEYRMAMFEGVSLNGTEFPHLAVVGQRDCVNKYKQCFEPAQMDDETEAVDPYFSRVYLHWDDPKTDNLCGGTLVDYNIVLTSAHCTFNSRGESPTKVSIVNHQAGITEIERHPDFKQGSLYNDVALIRLDKYVRIAKWIAPVCLPYVEALEGHDTTPETFSCRVPKDGFNDKLQIYIPSKSRCSSNDTVYDEEYMARFPEGLGKRLSCFGTEYRLVPGLGEIDAGGPLLSRDETIIFGVNAYATDCGSFKPLITTDVAPLIPWIEKFVLRKQKK